MEKIAIGAQGTQFGSIVSAAVTDLAGGVGVVEMLLETPLQRRVMFLKC